MYDLFSVIVHEGKTTSDGHYYCYVKGEDDVRVFPQNSRAEIFES